jgi:hypothetical protein
LGDETTQDAHQPAPPPEAAEPEPVTQDEVGDFIAGHVLEKDTVFFEG